MRTVLVTFMILTSAARWTTAEINAADTIEWVTADSEVVVVGKITSVASRKGEGSVTWHVATVDVSETIKGTPAKQVQFVMRHMHGDSPATWRARKSELLLFLVPSARRVKHEGGCGAGICDYNKAALALRPSHGDTGVFELGATTTGRANTAYTSAFTTITKRDDLLAAVRAAAKSKATEAHRLDAPYDSDAFKALWSGSSVWLFLPVDAALEKLAHGWITAKGLHTRAEGVRALAHFKSADNARRLEKLLADPDFVEITESGKPTVRRYLVRKAAHEQLLLWGAKHTTPVIDSP